MGCKGSSVRITPSRPKKSKGYKLLLVTLFLFAPLIFLSAIFSPLFSDAGLCSFSEVAYRQVWRNRYIKMKCEVKSNMKCRQVVNDRPPGFGVDRSRISYT